MADFRHANLMGWAIQLPSSQYNGLRHLRGYAGVFILEVGDCLWARGTAVDDEIDKRIRCVAPTCRYAWLDDDQIVPLGHQVPDGYLPVGDWAPLDDWFDLSLQSPAAIPSSQPSTVAIRCVRSQDVRPANLLLAPFAAWFDYGIRAPKIRLDPLTFATRDDGMTVIRGEPTPPVPGRTFVEIDGVAVESGWTWEPAVSPRILRRVFRLRDNDLALLDPRGNWERIAVEHFVRASRSALRATRTLWESTP